jgi:EmrB/QacA subfamily drug resistance transporter
MRLRMTLLGVMLVLLLAMLDNMIVNTAMSTVVRDLGGIRLLTWVVTAYALASAITTPIWGKLGDLLGRKRVFLTAIIVFLAGSALAGASTSMTMLIAFRTLQGVGAGGLMVGAFALIGTLVAPRERGRYQGMTASVLLIGTIGGPLIGGLITDHLGWRWAFYVNIPVGLVAVAWCASMLKLPAVRRRATIDVLGILLLATVITGLVLTTTWAGVRYPYASPEILTLSAVTTVALVLFVIWERRSDEPLLPSRVFGPRNYRLAVIMLAMIGAVMFGASTYLPLFQQIVQGASPSRSGLLLLPMLLPSVICSQIAGRTMTRTGRYKVFPVVGGVLLTVSTLLLATMGTRTSTVTTALFMALLGAGLGCTMQMTSTIAQNSVDLPDLGAAAAGTSLFQTAGGSVGLSLFGSLMNRALGGAATAHPGTLATATHHIFLGAAGPAVIVLIAALFIVEMPLRSAVSPRTEPAATPETAPTAV